MRKFYDINIRGIYALHAVGRSSAANAVLIRLMNLPRLPEKFGRYSNEIGLFMDDVTE
jgi:hypothetical protein